jgi:AP-1 complex subunit mu
MLILLLLRLRSGPSRTFQIEVEVCIIQLFFAPYFTSYLYIVDADAIVWNIKQFTGSKEYLMRAHFGLPSISSEDNEQWKAPIEVKFEIPYFTVSGLQVRYLKIIEKSGYQALPWVRYITMNGNYQLRMT